MDADAAAGAAAASHETLTDQTAGWRAAGGRSKPKAAPRTAIVAADVPTGVAAIPGELVGRILLYLPRAQQARLARVSLAWQKLVYLDVLYRRIRVVSARQLALLLVSLACQQSPLRTGLARAAVWDLSLELPPYSGPPSTRLLTEQLLQILRLVGGTLRVLSACHLPLEASFLAAGLDHLQTLSHIELDGTLLGGDLGTLIGRLAPLPLHVFKLAKATHIPGEDICRLFELPRLRSLTVHEAPLLRERDFGAALLSCRHRLVELELQSCSDIQVFLLCVALFCCPLLERLVLLNCGDRQASSEELLDAVAAFCLLHGAVGLPGGDGVTGPVWPTGPVSVASTPATPPSPSTPTSPSDALARQRLCALTRQQLGAMFHCGGPAVGDEACESLGLGRNSARSSLAPSATDCLTLNPGSARSSWLCEPAGANAHSLRALRTLAYSAAGRPQPLMPAVQRTLAALNLDAPCALAEDDCQRLVLLYPSVETMVLSCDAVLAVDSLVLGMRHLHSLNLNGCALDLAGTLEADEALARAAVQVLHVEDCHWLAPGVGRRLAMLLPRLREISVSVHHHPFLHCASAGSSTSSGRSATTFSSEFSNTPDSPPSPGYHGGANPVPWLPHGYSEEEASQSGSGSGNGDPPRAHPSIATASFGSGSGAGSAAPRASFVSAVSATSVERAGRAAAVSTSHSSAGSHVAVPAYSNGSTTRFRQSSAPSHSSGGSAAQRQRDMGELAQFMRAAAMRLTRISLVVHEETALLLDVAVAQCPNLEALRVFDAGARLSVAHLGSLARPESRLRSLDLTLLGGIDAGDLCDFLARRPPQLFQCKIHGELRRASDELQRLARQLDCFHTTPSVDMWQISEHSAESRGWLRQFEAFHFSSIRPFTV